MKKIISIIASTLALTFFSATSLAATGEGTVDQIRVCGTGNNGWVNLTYFKLSDGKWFLIHTNHSSQDHDDNASYSLLMTAYASRFRIKVNANYQGNRFSSVSNVCGINPDGRLWNVAGDYIELIEYSQ